MLSLALRSLVHHALSALALSSPPAAGSDGAPSTVLQPPGPGGAPRPLLLPFVLAAFVATVTPLVLLAARLFREWRSGRSDDATAAAAAAPGPTLGDLAADLAHHRFCGNAIHAATRACCPLFEYVASTQLRLFGRFGTVLDAGTGGHSLEFVAAQETCTAWTAVTADARRAAVMQKLFCGRGRGGGGLTMRAADEILTGNWKDPALLSGHVYDVVLADYLLGSIDAFAPYTQWRLFSRLRPHVRRALYVIGAEPLPDVVGAENPHGRLVVAIAKARDAATLLAGARPYREYPLDWVLGHLALAGFAVRGVGFFDTRQTREMQETQLRVAEARLPAIQSPKLRAELAGEIRALRARADSFTWGVTFGSDYVVCVVPRGGGEGERRGAGRAHRRGAGGRKGEDGEKGGSDAAAERGEEGSAGEEDAVPDPIPRPTTHVPIEAQEAIFPIDHE